ncbi:MAG: hypothetical protein ABUT39_08855 [Acidobacteriota bacterium]
MKSKVWLSACVALALAFPMGASAARPGEEGDPAVLAMMAAANEQLRAMGLNLSVEQVEFFTFGESRPLNRAHQSGNRRVPGDPRRNADGNNMTYLVDQSDGNTASGLSAADTEAGIDRAMATWAAEPCMTTLLKRPDTGEDPDVFDALLGYGSVGTPFLADIVEAGWMPRGFFEAQAPGGGRGIVAVTITFTFRDPVTGEPTDIDGDNYLDTAFSEVYYNDNFGDPNGDRPANTWGLDVALPRVDVETVSVHENGHSLELGHFGPPPTAVMNPRYAGILHDLRPIDHAGICAVWGSWPK